MKPDLNYIKSCIEKLGDTINAPSSLLPTYGNARDSHPNIEVGEKSELSYEISERGQEIRREYALNLDHLLYLVFRDITFSMASDFVASNRYPEFDNRRLLFQKQLDLLGILSEDWKRREKEHQEQVLLIYPFNDTEGKRQTYIRELMGNGFLYEEALAKANEKYP